MTKSKQVIIKLIFINELLIIRNYRIIDKKSSQKKNKLLQIILSTNTKKNRSFRQRINRLNLFHFSFSNVTSHSIFRKIKIDH